VFRQFTAAGGITINLQVEFSNLIDDDGSSFVNAAFSYRASEYIAVRNGQANPPFISSNLLPSPVALRIGGRDDAFQLNGHIKQLTYFPKSVTLNATTNISSK